jgi:threonine/homoserine/homoserine lactone efflux protein
MPDGAHLAAFALAATTIALIPGPGILFVLARSLSSGRAIGLRTTIGTALGGSIHVVAAAVGLSAIVATSATAFSFVKYLGAAYLVYLGIRTLMGRGGNPTGEVEAGPPTTTAHAVRQGVLTEALNPKTALFFLTFLPQFCQPENGPVAFQLMMLGALSVALNTLVDVVVACGAGSISERLRTRPKLWRRQQIATGSLLIALGAVAATGQRTD